MTTTSISTRLGSRKLTARIGAEVTGIGTGPDLGPGTVTRGDASRCTPVAGGRTAV
jgi:hypothetical protein